MWGKFPAGSSPETLACEFDLAWVYRHPGLQQPLGLRRRGMGRMPGSDSGGGGVPAGHAGWPLREVTRPMYGARLSCHCPPVLDSRPQ